MNFVQTWQHCISCLKLFFSQIVLLRWNSLFKTFVKPAGSLLKRLAMLYAFGWGILAAEIDCFKCSEINFQHKGEKYNFDKCYATILYIP